MVDYREKLRSHKKDSSPSADNTRNERKMSTTNQDKNNTYNSSGHDTVKTDIDDIDDISPSSPAKDTTTNTTGVPLSPSTPPMKPKQDIAQLFPPSPHGRKSYEYIGDRYMIVQSHRNSKASSSSSFYQESPVRDPWEGGSGNNDRVPTISLMSDEEMDPMTRTRHLFYNTQLAGKQSDTPLRNPFLDDDQEDNDEEQPFLRRRISREEEVLRFVTPLRAESTDSTFNDANISQQARRPYIFTVSNDTHTIRNISPVSTPSHLLSPPHYDISYSNNDNDISDNDHNSPASHVRSTNKRSSDAHIPPSSYSSTSVMTDTFPTIPDPNARQFSTSIFSSNLRDLILSTNSRREINPTPIKVLDAPELQDDFYLNLIDWGPNGCVAVGLGTCIYIWNSRTSIVTKLADLLNHKITSVSWNKLIPLLAVGVDDGRTLLYDVRQEGLIRTWDTHAGRVSALDWTHNVLTTGGRDHTIYHHDVRSPEPSFRTLTGHGAEVCGIKWSPDSSKLATGGNDNRLMIWNVTDSTPLYDFKHHTAAVKAIAWNPSRRGILVSGGGTADKTIKFWNTLNGKLLRSYNTGSQICNLSWLKRTGELVSTHGYADGAAKLCNQVFVWKPEQMRKLATLSGHTSRVLYMSVSPDERTIVTGAGDETLRFWDISSPEDEVAPEAPPSFESRSDQIR